MTSTASIRKAAILVSLLDARSADALLEPMGNELAAKVRNAIMDLDGVSAEEQDEVLADFFGRSAADQRSEGGVEMELSAVENEPTSTRSPATEKGAFDGVTAPSLAFLADVPPAVLADVLPGEHPQTVAVVIAHLPAEHAAQVLERLPPLLATEALSRMAWLTTPAPEILADLERELRRRLGHYGQTSSGGPAGLSSVRAILASLSSQRRALLLDRLSRRDERLASRLEASAAARPSGPSQDAKIFAFRYRLKAEDQGQTQADRGRAVAPAPLVEFEDLSLLNDRDLARLVTAADPQWLALALCEADERFARRVVRTLPARRAADIHCRLAHPGPIRLKEIDQAQRQLADLARRLASSGQISLPSSRRFAAAA